MAIVLVVAPCADASTVTPVAGASVLVGTPGADVVNSADGRAEEVWCGGGRDVVSSDAIDRVWGDCETLDGRAWQTDRFAGSSSGSSADLDAVAGIAGWIDRGRLTLLRGGRVQSRVWPAGRSRAADLDLGRDARGRPVAVARVCPAGARCPRWLVYDLATGRARSLPLSPPAGCAASSVAVWRRSTALGATCGIGEQRVYVATAGRAWRLLLTAPPSGVDGGAVRVDAGQAGIAAWVGGHAWLLGPAPCAQALDETLADAHRPAVSGPPRFAGDRIVWPQSAWAAGEADWVTVAQVRPRCSVRSRRYAIVAHRVRAAAITGATLLTLVGRSIERRPLATVPGPLEPPPPAPPPLPHAVIAEAAPAPAPPPSPYASLVDPSRRWPASGASTRARPFSPRTAARAARPATTSGIPRSERTVRSLATRTPP